MESWDGYVWPAGSSEYLGTEPLRTFFNIALHSYYVFFYYTTY